MDADIQGLMGFALQRDVIADSERKGLKRAQMRSRDYSEASEFIDFHRCGLKDCSTNNYPIDFFKMGFDTIDLSQNPDLQSLLTKVRQQGFLEKSDVRSLRSSLKGKTFKLANGRQLRIVYVAGEGLIVRNSGPNGMAVEHDELVPKNSRQAAAMLIHGDQDVYGYPLKRLLKGAAPWIFRHDSPDGKNHLSPVNLVNLWIPL